jgi:primosomal protein N' (replication factor Y)
MEVVNVVIPPLPTAYTYRVPPKLLGQVGTGTEVEVSLGARAAVGYVVPLPSGSLLPEQIALKDIIRVRRNHPLFLESQLRFFQWVADYYADSLSNVIETAVPPPVPQKYERYLSLTDVARSGLEQGSLPRLGKVERHILDVLARTDAPTHFRLVQSQVKGTAAAVKRLSQKGLLVLEERELVDQHLMNQSPPDWAKTTVSLSVPQAEAVAQIVSAARDGTYQPYLLDGVTGSGKTEVYIEAAKEVLAIGRGVLVIVPEIALTPQLIDRFKARLGNSLAILHSGLHPRVRWDGWRALLEGRCAIGIGARSAVFAPIETLGLIIVDEEHDSSYKQQEGLRYHARDLALVRGKLHQCPVVLGTATPSLESFANASFKRYHYLRLDSRPGTIKPPDIEIVDLNRLKPWEMKSRSISPVLFEAITRTLHEQQQVFILYNRRGFASYLQCEHCNTVVSCPHCSVTLTLHKHTNALVCHYCGIHQVPPSRCTTCATAASTGPNSPTCFIERGSGTERVFDELAELFPGVVIDRLDRDVVTDGEHYRQILDRVRSGGTNILVGTQMIAKGHDLPGVTLVGVVDCDVGLHMPDFRAAERVFQLLTQVSGRSGRGEQPGRVILQTRVASHPSIVYTKEHDYRAFALHELEVRKSLHYPPFTRMVRILASSVEKEVGGALLTGWAKEIARLREQENLNCSILGPCPAPIERIKTLWRWHLLIKCASPREINRFVRHLQTLQKKSKQVRVVFDIDPQDML